MSAKIKHNKKRNTIFLYEALVRELTKATVEKDQDRRQVVLNIVKEHFGQNTLMGREVKYTRTSWRQKIQSSIPQKRFYQNQKLNILF